MPAKFLNQPNGGGARILPLPTVDAGSLLAGSARVGEALSQPVLARSTGMTGEGLASLARGVGEAAEVATKLEASTREAEKDWQLSEAKGKLQAAWTEHLEWQQNNPDPRKWNQAWEKKASSVLGGLKKLEMHPEAKHELGLLAEEFASQRHADVAMLGQKRLFALADSGLQAKQMERVRFGDFDGAREVVNERIEKGYAFPHEKERLEAEIAVESDRQKREDRANETAAKLATDPWALRETMDTALAKGEPLDGWDEADMLQARTAADRAIEAKNSETRDRLGDELARWARGEETGTSEQSIELLAEFEKLPPAETAEFVASFRKMKESKAKAGPFDHAKFAEVRRKQIAYNPATDPDGKKWTQLYLEGEALRGGGGAAGDKLASSLEAAFWYKAPGGENRERKPPAPSVPTKFQRALGELLEADESAGVFGDQKKPENQKKAAEARLQAYEDLEMEWNRKGGMDSVGFKAWYQHQMGRSQGIHAMSLDLGDPGLEYGGDPEAALDDLLLSPGPASDELLKPEVLP